MSNNKVNFSEVATKFAVFFTCLCNINYVFNQNRLPVLSTYFYIVKKREILMFQVRSLQKI